MGIAFSGGTWYGIGKQVPAFRGGKERYMAAALMTKRGEALLRSGETPWTKYPRPQMRRNSYVNLNGEWDFAAQKEPPETYPQKIRVPFPPESRLSGIEQHFPEGTGLFYRRFFTLPEGFRKDRVLLHIGAADQICEVYVNQIPVGFHEGGYDSFSLDITAALKDGKNELLIRCADDLKDRSFPYGKQTLKRGGMWYTPVSGIWQTVWLESVPETYIEKLNMSCFRQDSNAELSTYFANGDEPDRRGVTEIKHIMGQYRLWDALLAKYPGLMIDNCASGGRRIDISLPISYEQADENKYTLIIDGLLGGHSGVMINKGRTNAIKRLCEYLSSFGDIRLISISGGVADNAIPPSAAAEFVSPLNLNELSEIADRLKKSLDETYEKENITLALAGKANRVMTAKSSENLISLINDIPYGVIKMSEEIPDMTETSINLGIISTDGLRVNITTALRSSKDDEKERLAARVKEIGARYSADINEHGDYPGWEYKKDSHLRDIMCEIYRNMYDKDPSVVTIHAGLECGLFSMKIAGLDCISMGPLAYDIHTPDERLSVSSTERVWEYLKEVLKNI